MHQTFTMLANIIFYIAITRSRPRDSTESCL